MMITKAISVAVVLFVSACAAEAGGDEDTATVDVAVVSEALTNCGGSANNAELQTIHWLMYWGGTTNCCNGTATDRYCVNGGSTPCSTTNYKERIHRVTCQSGNNTDGTYVEVACTRGTMKATGQQTQIKCTWANGVSQSCVTVSSC